MARDLCVRINREVSVNLLLLVGLVGAGCWYFRADLRGHFATQRPVPTSTVLFSWTDNKGVVHFSQEGPDHRSRAIMVSTDRITPIDPLTEEQLSRIAPERSLASGAKVLSSGRSSEQESADIRAGIEARATND